MSNYENTLFFDKNTNAQEKSQNNNSKKIKIIAVTLVFLLSFISSIFSSFYQHELVHQKIFEKHGINSTIGIESLTHFYTRPDITQFLYFCKENQDDCKNMLNLHLLNEIVAYNISSIEILLLGIFILLYLLLLELIEMRK